MATAGTNPLTLSPIFRLDRPAAVDLKAIEAVAGKPSGDSCLCLTCIFETAQQRHCQQFSVEPDATLWRIRYQTVDGYDEHIINDPSSLSWSLNALQFKLWGDGYHKKPNRSARFTFSGNSTDQVVALDVLHTVNGDVLHFNLEHLRSLPPVLEEIGFTTAQLMELRLQLKEQHGTMLLTSPEPAMLNNLLLAINQELISPDHKLLSIHDRHRYSLPRTMQIDLPANGDQTLFDVWQNALDTHYDALLLNATVPAQFYEKIAINCEQGGLTIQALRVARAADTINMLNTSSNHRAHPHRAATSIVSHYPVRSICQHCGEVAQLNDAEKAWLEQLRTPITENVVDWLKDGNTEQFKSASGCETCANTGEGAPLAVFDIVHRNEFTHLFPGVGSVDDSIDEEQINYLQRHLMSLAKAGKITLSEVLRVLKAS